MEAEITKKDKIQQVQEDEYNFPYHHVPEYKKYFTQCFNFTWGINYVATIEFLIDKLKHEEFNSLVDIGCGDGRLTKELALEFKNRIVEGIDYSETSINLARAMHSQGKYSCIDIIKQPGYKKFDVAVLMEVFEHISPELGDIFLKSVADLIVEGGHLIMTVPHLNMTVESKHYRHFSISSISECLEKYFDIAEIIPFESLDVRKKIIDTILTNKIFILNNGKLKNLIYKYYKERLFLTNTEDKCKRIFIKAKLREHCK